MTILITLLVLVLDIVSKIVVVNYLTLNKSIKLVNNFLYLTYVRNTGAAWSIFEDKPYIVLIVSLMILGVLIYHIYKNKSNIKFEKISYGLILGGAIGNFLNRIINGYVIDFIDIRIFNYHYPIFNLADIFIVVGVILLIIYNWRNNDGNKCK